MFQLDVVHLPQCSKMSLLANECQPRFYLMGVHEIRFLLLFVRSVVVEENRFPIGYLA